MAKNAEIEAAIFTLIVGKRASHYVDDADAFFDSISRVPAMIDIPYRSSYQASLVCQYRCAIYFIIPRLQHVLLLISLTCFDFSLMLRRHCA